MSLRAISLQKNIYHITKQKAETINKQQIETRLHTYNNTNIENTISNNNKVLTYKDKFKIELSRFHINRIITDNNITLKITRIRHERFRFSKENLKPTLNKSL